MARVAGEKDMATNRTIEFIKKAAAAEGKSDLSQKIIDGAVKESTIPDVLRAVESGKADAGIVYLSAAVTVADKADIVSFPAKVNLSENIRNVVTIPGTARNVNAAESFVKLMLSAEGRQILKKTGQPPIVPPIRFLQEDKPDNDQDDTVNAEGYERMGLDKANQKLDAQQSNDERR